MTLRSNRLPDIIYRRPRPFLVSPAIMPPGLPDVPGGGGFVPEPSWLPKPDPPEPPPFPKPQGDPVPTPRPMPRPVPKRPEVRQVKGVGRL